MSQSTMRASVRILAVAAATAFFCPAQGLADDLPDRPKIDCSKPANKNKPACKPHNGQLSDDEIHNAAYWLAHEGKYEEALALLGRAKNKNDARLLNQTGFVTRKLGDVDGAFPYYAKALAIDPNYTLAREYLGEAFLSKGDVKSAHEQLGEIEKRCGTGCAEYAKLAQAIADFEQEGARGG
jgi:tetratricopeptide (TPR) repeat protein